MWKFKEKGRTHPQRKAVKGRNRKKNLGEVEDYCRYSLDKREWIVCMGMYIGIDGVVSYLFYRSWIAFAFFLPFGYFFIKERKKNLGKERRGQLEKEFLTGLQAVSTGLSAGYSIENAMKEALMELKRTLGEESIVIKEFSWIVRGISMNESLEHLFCELADRSGVEVIEEFAAVFAVARKRGGDLPAIIRNTVKSIYQKQEIRQEIMVSLAAKRMEQKVMSVIPFLILLYSQKVSSDFLSVLYHNTMGITVMTGCLTGYLFSWFLGRKIVDIKI